MDELQVTGSKVKKMERAIRNWGKSVLRNGFQRISLQAENEQFQQPRFQIFVHQVVGANLTEVIVIVVQEEVCQIRLGKSIHGRFN